MKKLVIVLLVILSIFASNSAAQAADWIWVCNSKEGDPIYLDASDISVQAGILTYQVKHDILDPLKFANIKSLITKDVRTVITKVEYKTSNNTYRPTQTIAYYKNGKSQSYRNDKWIELPILEPISDTTGAAFYTLFEQQDWVYVDQSVAFRDLDRRGDKTFFCLKFKPDNRDTFSYSVVVYNASTQSALTYILTFKAPESNTNSGYYFFYLQNIGYQPTDEDTPFNNALKKAIAKINEIID
jgi:hypothetical protein